MVGPKASSKLSGNSNKRNRDEVKVVDNNELGQNTHDLEGLKTRQKAVAIKDSSQAKTRPRIVASGQGTFAEQILQIAWANNIKVREDADLVEILSAIDIDSEIPVEVFAAVAEILAYVYKANTGEIPTRDIKDKKEID